MKNFMKRVKELQDLVDSFQVQLALDKTEYLLRTCTSELSRNECSYLHEQRGNMLKWLHRIPEALEAYWQAAKLCQFLEPQRLQYSDYLMLSHYIDGITDQELSQRHFFYNHFFFPEQQIPHQKSLHAKHSRLRIGYLSGDFRQHVMANFMIQLLACHDRSQYKIYAYDYTKEHDDATEQLRSLVEVWRMMEGPSAREDAARIAQDEIDILVDLGGHSNGGYGVSVAGYKPAPVQVSGLGYMSTTGLQAMDYFLTDVYCDPIGHGDALFSEQLIRLPQTHFCYTPMAAVYHATEHYQCHDPIVFGSFNNVNKITDRMLAVWLQILQQVPGSRLILKTPHVEWESRGQGIAVRARNIGYQEGQLEIRAMSSEYYREYMDLDIALDTYPYTGGGTTCDALYLGVPVITLTGTRHGTRFGYSLLHNVGLEELAVQSVEEYIQKAVALANDPDLLAALHERLPEMMHKSPLMDGKAYTRAIESAYQEIWQRWIQGE